MTTPDPTVSAGLRRKARVPTGNGHELAYAEFGRAGGLPVLHVHGGPGSGANPGDTDLFELERPRLILFDQRGAGDATPAGVIDHNETAHLLEDIERLRLHLGIERWLVSGGGSWGGMLALEYPGGPSAAHTATARIMASSTLIKLSPPPVQRLIGDTVMHSQTVGARQQARKCHRHQSIRA